MTWMKKSRFCGWSYCSGDGDVSVVSDIGGWFGYLCHDHSDQLNKYMERNMERNQVQAERSSDECPEES